MLFTIIYDWNL